jgi:hypothetical protein
MGTEIKDIVVVNITRETARITRVGFGTPMVFGIHTAFAEDFRIYTSLSDVSEDFLTTDEEFLAANAIFSQDLSPEQIIIGKRVANVAQQNTVTVATVEDLTLYTVTINGTAFTFTSDGDATNLEIAAGLVADIAGGSEPVTATDNSDGTFDLDDDVAGDGFSLVVDANLTEVENIPNTGLSTELIRFEQLNDDWYFLINTRRSTEDEQLQDITQASSYAETRLKLFFYAIDQATMLTETSANIGALLKALVRDRTVGMYSGDEENYPEAAYVGRFAPETPGSVTWRMKVLKSILVDSFTPTEISNLKANSLNFFENVGGVNVISSDAVVASGEFIDTMRGSDKLSTRMSERIFTTILNEPKIPLTNDGGATLENDIRAELQVSIDDGFIQGDTIIVTVPDASTLSVADRAARFYSGITFSANFQGAVHKVGIDGKLSL